MSVCNVDPKDTVYVGDMIYDYECKRAGVHFEYATWGFGDLTWRHSINSISNLI